MMMIILVMKSVGAKLPKGTLKCTVCSNHPTNNEIQRADMSDLDDDDIPGQVKTWVCKVCYKENEIAQRQCTTCKRPCPENTPLPKVKVDRFRSMIHGIVSSSDDDEDDEEREKEQAKKAKEQREEERKAEELKRLEIEAKKKKKQFDPKLYWKCIICGWQENLHETIRCKVCARPKPGHDPDVSLGLKRKPKKRIIWPDSRRIARRVFVKWNMHNGKTKKGKEVLFDSMGSDDPISRVCERIHKYWKIPVKDQSITAKSRKRKLPMDMQLDELDFEQDQKYMETGPAFVLFLATFRISKRALENRKKKSRWAKVNTKVKTIRNFREDSTVKVIQHFKIRGE